MNINKWKRQCWKIERQTIEKVLKLKRITEHIEQATNTHTKTKTKNMSLARREEELTVWKPPNCRN